MVVPSMLRGETTNYQNPTPPRAMVAPSNNQGPTPINQGPVGQINQPPTFRGPQVNQGPIQPNRPLVFGPQHAQGAGPSPELLARLIPFLMQMQGNRGMMGGQQPPSMSGSSLMQNLGAPSMSNSVAAPQMMNSNMLQRMGGM